MLDVLLPAEDAAKGGTLHPHGGIHELKAHLQSSRAQLSVTD